MAEREEQQETAAVAKPAGFPVVGIGASAGGLEALKRFFQAVPADSGVAFVLIQHLDPNHQSLMANLLDRHAPMPVEEARDGVALEPNHVYVIPPGKFIKIVDHGLFLDEPVQRRGMRLPIDHFFRSLADARGERAICIVLTGTGSDGSQGLREVKAAGGMAMVQRPDTAQYDGMPRSAVATGMVDFVLPVEDMPDALLRYVHHSYLDGTGTALDEKAPDQFRSVLRLLRAQTDYDFYGYKRGTLNRRIQRRMGLNQIDNLDDYLKLLRTDSRELQRLFKDLLISVTRFFREPEAWEALNEQFLAPLVRSKAPGGSLRVWVPGCATGEEAYTVAMLLFEQLERQQKDLEVQVFATDLDEDAIAVARKGTYSGNVAGDVGPRRLQRFFEQEGERYQVKKRLREATLFAAQNLISDPPFSRLDLITCRNVLIYLESEVQDRLIEMFHFALAEHGHLFLGSSESVGKQNKLFEPVSSKWRVYRRSHVLRADRGTFPAPPLGDRSRDGAANESGPLPAKAPLTAGEVTRRALLERFAPAAVLINRRHEALYFHGPVRNYLDIPTGEPTKDVVTMALEGLRGKLRTTLVRAGQDGRPVEAVALRVRRNGGEAAVRLRVEPLPAQREREPMLLVTFRDEVPAAPLPSSETPSPGDEQAVNQLEYELQATREDLQTTIEQMETSNEELRASNEEVMSMNEELQSTNEELETSREELQSLNEELSTVNSQLEEKVGELEATNDDLRNLLTSTDIATLFLDAELRIRRFTPATQELLRVIDGDVGRPVSDLAPRVNDPALLDDARAVLERLAPIEAEVQASDERWFLRRILPYRTAENRIEGVVVTFSDVSSLKATARQLEARERQQAAVAALGQRALSPTDLAELFNAAVRLVSETLHVELCKVLELKPDRQQMLLRAGVGWNDGLVGTATVGAGADSQAGYTLQSGGAVIVEELARETRFSGPPLLVEHGVVSGLSVTIGSVKAPWGVLGAHARQQVAFTDDDVNFLRGVANLLSAAIARERAERRIAELNRRLRRQLAEMEALYHRAPIGLALFDRDHRYLRINDNLAEINGIPAAEHPGRTVRELLPGVADGVEQLLKRVAETGEPVANIEMTGTTPKAPGVERHWLVSYYPLFDDDAEVVAVGVIVQEVTEAKRAERDLHDRTRQLEAIAEHAPDFIVRFDQRLRHRFVSRSLTETVGLPMNGYLGRTNEELGMPAELCALWNEALREVFAKGQPHRIEFDFSGATGTRSYSSIIVPEVSDDAQELETVLAFTRDVTEIKEGERALRESQERLNAAIKASGGGLYEHAVPLDESTYHSERWAEILGFRSDELPDHATFLDWLFERLHPDDVEPLRTVYEDFIANRRPDYEVESRLRHRDGHWIWVRGVSRALERDADGHVRRLVGLMFDVTEEKRAQQALNDSEARLRQVVLKAPIPIMVHALDGEILELSESFTRLTGYTRADVPDGHTWLMTAYGMTLEKAAAAHEDMIHRFNSQRPLERREAKIRTKNGDERIWLFDATEPMTAPDGRRFLASMAVDITERTRSEEQRQFLIAELNHRVKNTLTVVQALILRTFSGNGVKPELMQTLTGRLAALGRSHDLLTARGWAGVPLGALVRGELAAFSGDGLGKIRTDGPPMLLRAHAAVPLGMALHELATNAAKYGALSVPEGELWVSWSAQADGDGSFLVLSWVERGGPPVKPRARNGFGSRVVERGIAHDLKGEATAEFAPEGVSWTLRLPLAEVTTDAAVRSARHREQPGGNA